MALFTRPSCRRLLALCMLAGASLNANAMPMVWELNPVSGDIVRIDPRSGAVLGAFPRRSSRCRETCMPA